ncbi:TlpA family protein disulfide reductase [Nonlabens sp. Asnod3-A02]|uniref:TlpA family protein disulfide reductase n=1 Tax=Nonlabens sp. Asnod3-A02 TaxID=3160579 RepID=UPI0038682D88
MKNIFIILAAILITSCGEQAEKTEKKQAVKFADADISSNDIVHLTDFDDNYTNLDQILAENKGKVVYLDIWASWCGPCKAMMPYSEKLQEKYKGKDVTFIFISTDQDPGKWERAAKQFNLTENSFLARNYPKAKLFQDNNVSSIPRYMLFDKNGRMVDDNARRPAEKDLETTIDGFLAI